MKVPWAPHPASSASPSPGRCAPSSSAPPPGTKKQWATGHIGRPAKNHTTYTYTYIYIYVKALTSAVLSSSDVERTNRPNGESLLNRRTSARWTHPTACRHKKYQSANPLSDATLVTALPHGRGEVRRWTPRSVEWLLAFVLLLTMAGAFSCASPHARSCFSAGWSDTGRKPVPASSRDEHEHGTGCHGRGLGPRPRRWYSQSL